MFVIKFIFMKHTVFLFVLILFFISLKAQEFSKEYRLPKNQNNYSFAELPEPYIEIHATSSSNIKIVFNGRVSEGLEFNKSIEIVAPSYLFDTLAYYFRKFEKWHELSSKNNLKVEKELVSFTNPVEKGFSIPLLNHFKENDLIISLLTFTYSGGVLLISYNVTNSYGQTNYKLYFSSSLIKLVANEFSGENLKKLKKEIDDKIKLWDEFK